MRESGTAVVVGATVLGEGVAAELANVGWTVYLMDGSMESVARSYARLRSARPPLLYLPEFVERIHPVTFNELTLCRDADWVIEAVADQGEVKRRVLSRLELFVGPKTITTTTSTFHTVAELSAGCGDAFRARFFACHFVSPPRYQKLVELAPGPDTQAGLVEDLAGFVEEVLGHRVVLCQDSPGLVAQRLWLTHHFDALHTAVEQGVPLDLVEALTGPLIGRPMGIVRALDQLGLEGAAARAKALQAALPEDRWSERLTLPGALEKASQGLLGREGVFEPATGTYRPPRDHSPSRTHPYLVTVLEQFFSLVQALQPRLTASELALDQALEWGFGWTKGPFALEAEAHRHLFAAPSPPQQYLDLSHWSVVQTRESLLLRDLGDGVACLSFRTPQNTLTPKVCEELVALVERVEQEYLCLILGNEGPNFCQGFERERWWKAIQAQQWETIHRDIDGAQAALARLRLARVPVVGMLRGRTLGGGAELALHCTALQCSPETYFGLTQVHAGLLPCFGGITELQRRTGVALQTLRLVLSGQTFTSAHELRKVGILRNTDSISRNPDRLLFEARQKALALVEGFVPEHDEPVPVDGITTVLGELEQLHAQGRITAHELVLAHTVTQVLGGDGNAPEHFRHREREACLALCQNPQSQARLAHVLQTGTPLRN